MLNSIMGNNVLFKPEKLTLGRTRTHLFQPSFKRRRIFNGGTRSNIGRTPPLAVVVAQIAVAGHGVEG